MGLFAFCVVTWQMGAKHAATLGLTIVVLVHIPHGALSSTRLACDYIQ